MSTLNNLYPLWWIIDFEAQQALAKYQSEHYGTKIEIPHQDTADIIPVDWDKEVRKTPSRSRE